jgi:hypothetical protein
LPAAVVFIFPNSKPRMSGVFLFNSFIPLFIQPAFKTRRLILANNEFFRWPGPGVQNEFALKIGLNLVNGINTHNILSVDFKKLIGI